MKAMKEKLRQKEEQLQANQQQSSSLAAELRDASSTRDRTMSELYHMKLEADALRQAMAEAQAHCMRLERLVEQMKAAEAKKEAVRILISLLTGYVDEPLHLLFDLFDIITSVMWEHRNPLNILCTNEWQ